MIKEVLKKHEDIFIYLQKAFMQVGAYFIVE